MWSGEGGKRRSDSLVRPTFGWVIDRWPVVYSFASSARTRESDLRLSAFAFVGCVSTGSRSSAAAWATRFAHFAGGRQSWLGCPFSHGLYASTKSIRRPRDG